MSESFTEKPAPMRAGAPTITMDRSVRDPEALRFQNTSAGCTDCTAPSTHGVRSQSFPTLQCQACMEKVHKGESATLQTDAKNRDGSLKYAGWYNKQQRSTTDPPESGDVDRRIGAPEERDMNGMSAAGGSCEATVAAQYPLWLEAFAAAIPYLPYTSPS
eukprot:GHVU01041077.1.p2 GENE.GHVU01041077.1~~GHVU01041077.1.p2  ORF type:complete len:160 (+),score=17.89 GHVU01041077.1:389-868(+)